MTTGCQSRLIRALRWRGLAGLRNNTSMEIFRVFRLASAAFLLAAAAGAQIVPPGNVRVPAEERPTQPFIWSERRLLTAPELFDAPAEWVSRSLAWADFILNSYRPGLPEHPLRRAALIRLDDVLHIESAPRMEAVQKFYVGRMRQAVEEIERTHVTSGVRVWKLYNHGFLVRTPSASFTFDIVPGTSAPGFRVPPELLQRLAAQSDATFISHLHSDHASQEVARIFLAQNKPVVAPEGLWSGVADLAAKLTYPKRSTETVHSIELSGGRVLQVVAYPGHQGATVINNVYLVTSPEGFIVVHTGDQWNDDVPGSDFDWIAHIARRHRVDILLPNCWARGLAAIARGVNPRLIITGHENEMAHTVDHREDYTQTYTRLQDVPYPFVLMAWGESYQYQRVETPDLGLH